MAWIESHQSLLTHRKTLALAEILRVSKYLVIGHLHTLWWYALDNVPSDGSLGANTTDKMLGVAAGWRGKGNFAEALRQAGFISDGKLHNWPFYAGKLQDQREAHRESMRRSRANHVPSTNGSRAGAPYPTVPNPTEPNQLPPMVPRGGRPERRTGAQRKNDEAHDSLRRLRQAQAR